MAVAIEDAGFQIRDQIMWVYGSGFPKSHNISKGIDKAAGAEREVIGETIKGAQTESTGRYGAWGDGITPTAPATLAAQQWDGWGTALKPAHEPMVLARKPLEGTVANNVLTFGVGGLNIDGTRVGSEGGTFKASKPDGISNGIYGEGINGKVDIGDLNAGRFPANFIHDGSDEVVALFPSNVRGGAGATKLSSFNFDVSGENLGQKLSSQAGLADSGSAARFFYCAKASKRDRNEGLDGFEAKRDHDGRADGGVGGDNPRNRTNNAKLNHHPTVKPTTLMQYLVRLVTPPNGIVLDPFMGSGSTGKACAYEGFDFIGIDQSAEYVAIAQARIDFALADKSE
jgi:site-specific DNA-methyltransferase (adenine-specific)